MLVQHIINDRIWWFHLWRSEGGPAIAACKHWEAEEAGQSVHSTAELLAGLETTWEMIAGALARWTVADPGDMFEPPASLSDRERQIFGANARQEIIWHMLRHDIHHGGEVAGMGAPPAVDLLVAGQRGCRGAWWRRIRVGNECLIHRIERFDVTCPGVCSPASRF